MERLHSDYVSRSHLVSHGGKVTVLDRKRDVAGVDELFFSTFYFAPEGNEFLEAAGPAPAVSGKTPAQVDIVECNCVVDIQRRVAALSVLVVQGGKKRDSFHYSLMALNSSNTLEPRVEFKLPYLIKDNVCILQGPAVLWTHDSSVFYASPQTEGVSKAPIQMSHCVFGELPLHRGQMFALGLRLESEQSLNNPSTGPIVCYFPADGHLLNGTMIMPHPYLCITECMLVLTADRIDDEIKCAVVAATSKQQLVHFENGMVKDVCQIPFEQAEHIHMVDTGRHGCLLVVFFKQGHVCAVCKETFQISSMWSGVSSVHVDDFLLCGTDQMLLLFKDQQSNRQTLDKFLITDLCGISYSRGQDSEAAKTDPPLQENYLLTLRALESRLQSGLIVLQELESELSVKERVLQQSVHVLSKVLSGREAVLTPHEQEGLVSLWDNEDESMEETSDDRTQNSTTESLGPQVHKLWHRVTEDRLVIGVILTTHSTAPVASVSLSLLTEEDQRSAPAVIQTQSQAFWLPALGLAPPTLSPSSSSTAAFSEPAAKRSKQDIASDDFSECGLAVTGTTELAPLLTSGCVKCCIMLHYTPRTDAFSGTTAPPRAALHCSRVALNIKDVSQKRLLESPLNETDELLEDLLSLLAVLDQWVLHIESPDYSLGNIDGWIRSRVDCQVLEGSPPYLLLNSSGSSAPMLLQWHQTAPFQGQLSVHSRQLQMLQFLDSLLAFLPASCLIQPVKCSTGGQSSARALGLALEKEVLSLRESLSWLTQEEEKDDENPGEAQTPELSSIAGLQRCRSAWQRSAEKSRTKMSPLVEPVRYREAIWRVLQVQMEGDLAALSETQRNAQS